MKTALRYLLTTTLAVFLSLSAALAAETDPVKHVDAAGAAKLLKVDSKVVVLDIRTPEEFAAGHIKGATNINFNADSFRANVQRLDPGRTYLVHCASGGRSTRSLDLFKQLGFKSVVHLDGGLRGWEKAGQPVAKADK
jgi:rhodanese-related sulfurtransferase